MDNPKQRLVSAITAMLAGMKRRNSEEIDNRAAMAVYIEDLRDLPIDAVERICRLFRRGDLDDGIFAPTAGQIRQEVLKSLARYERKSFDALPPPVSMTPDARARVAAGLEALVKGLGASNNMGAVSRRGRHSGDLTKPEAEDSLERLRADPQPMPQLSDAALRAVSFR